MVKELKLVTLLDKVRQRIRAAGLDVAKGGDINPMDIDMVVTETVRAFGLEINPQTGQIYNPERDDNQISIAGMHQQAIYSGMPSKRGRAKRYR